MPEPTGILSTDDLLRREDWERARAQLMALYQAWVPRDGAVMWVSLPRWSLFGLSFGRRRVRFVYRAVEKRWAAPDA